MTTRERKTNPGGSDHGSDGLTPQEREDIYRALMGVELRLKTEVQEFKNDVHVSLKELDEKHDKLSEDVKEILMNELKKSREQGAIRGTVAGGGITALILALVPLIEKLLG